MRLVADVADVAGDRDYLASGCLDYANGLARILNPR